MKKLFGLICALWASVALATVTTTSSSVEYDCNSSTTVFNVSFPFLANGDLVVKKITGNTTVTLTLTTDYTVAGAGGSSGSITTVGAGSPCATGSALIISRAVTATQTTSFRTQGSFSPALHERAFDKLTMLAQQKIDQGALKGAWDSGTAYIKGDLVSLVGNTYMAIIPNINSEPPSINWQIFTFGAPNTSGNATGLVLSTTGTGALTTYGGTSCTSQFPRSLNASGVATCASVANTDLASVVDATHGGLGATQPTCALGQHVTCNGTTCSCTDDAGAAALTPKYLVQQADASLPNAQAMGALGTGIVKNTTTTGVQSIATSGTDYAPGTSSNGTGLVLSTTGTGALSAYGGASCTNQFPRSLNASGAATCASVADADLTGTIGASHGGLGATQPTCSAGQHITCNGTSCSCTADSGGVGFTAARLAVTSTFATSSQTNVTITGLSWSGVSGTPYSFTCNLIAQAISATDGSRYSVTSSGSATLSFEIVNITTSATSPSYLNSSASGTQTATCTSGCYTTIQFVRIQGVVIPATSVTLAIATATSAGTANGSTVYSGSSCLVMSP